MGGKKEEGLNYLKQEMKLYPESETYISRIIKQLENETDINACVNGNCCCLVFFDKTMGEQYPAMYEEKPVTIAIMPPINQTTHAEAKDYFTRQCTFLYVRKDTMSFLRI